MKTKTLILLACVLALFGCRKAEMPPTPAPSPARTRLLTQTHFRLGTLDFGHTAGTQESKREVVLAKALPAMLVTELKKTGRFAVHEGGGIRDGGGAVGEVNAADFVDGYVSGTITSENATQVCFDVRLENAVNHEVLFAQAACAGVQASEGTLVPEREALTRLADEISRSIKQVGNGYVSGVDGKLVFVDKGKAADVTPGMVAYIVGTGDTVPNASTHALVKEATGVDPASLKGAKTPVIIGEMYVMTVEDDYSVGLLYRGDYALPGDTVFFK